MNKIESRKDSTGTVFFSYSGANQTLRLALVPTVASPANPRCIADGYLYIEVSNRRYTGKAKYDLSKIPAKLPSKMADAEMRDAYAAIVPDLRPVVAPILGAAELLGCVVA